MKTKLFVSILFAIVTAIIIYSCSDNFVEQSSSSEVNSELNKSVITEELSELIDIREEITQMVIDRKVNIKKLSNAYKSKDVKIIMHTMKMSKKEYDSYNKRLLNLREVILNKYPDIKAKVAELEKQDCTTCNSDKFFINFEKYTFASGRQGGGLNKIYTGGGYDDVDCEWAQFTAGLVLCSQAGPVFYWPCAYIVICSYCSGGWVDDVCM